MRLYLLSMLFSLVVLTSSAQQTLRLNFTDLWSALPLDSLSSYADSHAIQLESDFVGSLLAIDRLQAGQLDAALLALPSIDDFDLTAYSVQAVAYTAARIHVHRDNPIQEIGYEALQAIFDGDTVERLTRWDQIIEDASFMGPIRPYIVGDKTSIVADLLRYRVFPDGQYAADIPLVTKQAYLETVLSEPNSLCILPFDPQKDPSKSLNIRTKAGTAAFELNAHNLYYNDYSIAFTYYLVCQTDAIAEKLLPYFFSQQFVELITSHGHHALPEFARQ